MRDADADADRRRAEGEVTNGFSFSRWLGILVKEFIQLKRDRLTFGMIVGIPVMQLMLFGFAINTDPKHLPTAVLDADRSEFSRSFVARLANDRLLPHSPARPTTEAAASALLARGDGAVRRHHPGRILARSWCAASGPRCWSRPTPPIPRRPATRSPRSAGIAQTALDRELAGPLVAAGRRAGAVRRASCTALLQPGGDHRSTTSCPG